MKIDRQQLNQEMKEIESFLAQPDAYAKPDFVAKGKRVAEIKELLEMDAKIQQLQKSLEEAEALIDDPELGELAQADVEKIKSELEAAEGALEEKIRPRDPLDNKAAIMEIRAGAGGDEASLFAGELYRMYVRYAELHSLKTELISQNENEAGGVKEVIMRVSGEQAYGKLKFEGGVHRVQRVPVTESQGRVHTSTATVAVLPEIEESELEIKLEDLRIDIYRSGGHGGQSVNTTDSANA